MAIVSCLQPSPCGDWSPDLPLPGEEEGEDGEVAQQSQDADGAQHPQLGTVGPWLWLTAKLNSQDYLQSSSPLMPFHINAPR